MKKEYESPVFEIVGLSLSSDILTVSSSQDLGEDETVGGGTGGGTIIIPEDDLTE